PNGPGFTGLAAAAAILGVVPMIPVLLAPRLVPACLALLASWMAEESDAPTSPWTRVGVASAAAAAAAVLVSWNAPLGAEGAGLFAHELLWRIPMASFITRVALYVWVLRLPLDLPRLVNLTIRRPVGQPAPQPIEVAVLAAIFIALAIAHARMRAAGRILPT